MIGHNFILEGIDGTGKSTIAERLDVELNDRIKTTLMTSSPFDPKFCTKLKELLIDPAYDLDWLTETYLFGAIFKYHHNAFTSQIQTGMVNICDRGHFSTVAYQLANGGDCDVIWNVICDVYDDEFFDHVDIIILDTDNINNSLGRTEMDRFTYKGEGYYTKVRDYYRALDLDTNTHLINSDRPLDEVYEDVKKIVVDKLIEKNLIDA